jgi:hypothetical protein
MATIEAFEPPITTVMTLTGFLGPFSPVIEAFEPPITTLMTLTGFVGPLSTVVAFPLGGSAPLPDPGVGYAS